MKSSFFTQLKALLKKNFLLKKRSKRQFFQEFLYPVYFTAILAVIKLTTKTDTLSSIPYVSSYPLDNNTLGAAASGFIGKRILVSPDTPYIRTIASDSAAILQQLLNLPVPPTLEYYADQDAMLVAYQRNNSNIMAGIVFNYDGKSNTSYAIRISHDSAADTTTWIREQDQCRKAGNGLDSYDCDANKYIFSGFTFIQTAVDTAILRIVTGDAAFPVPEVSVQMMPKPEFTPDTSYLQTISAIYFVIAYSPFVSFLTMNLVAEKEKKIKQGMKMMGLQSAAFWLSWGITYFVIITLATVLIIVIVVATSFFSNSNVFIFFLVLLLYGLSIITMSCVLTTFFDKAQTAGGLASLASIAFSCLYLIVSLTRTMLPSGAVVYSISPGVRWLLCLISPAAVALAIDQAIFLDKPLNGGMNFDTITNGEFPLYAPMLMMFIDIILYFFLAMYLDNVIPGEFGAKNKPWYFLLPSFWCSKRDKDLRLLTRMESRQDGQFVEPVTTDLEDKTAVRLIDIHKEFKSPDDKSKMIAAVDGLSLDIYEGQITCLLGHNGAGKTTLVNMLTGQMRPTKGTASILGMDICDDNDMAKIRSMTGICTQHNSLFDDLSCLEHLHLFGAIKGVPDNLVAVEAETALKNVDLYKEKDTHSKNLSGGQKRKLSVAIALIGDPKLIFLDEPTAGMDPFSRRHLWSILKEKKEGRVILLTTHFMDEADILADRKAIISKGRLRCCGSSLYLKSKFGIGYHLGMVVEPACNSDDVTKLVQQCVPGGELKRSHGKELAYTLPLSEVENFAGLFAALEKPSTSVSTVAESMGIKTYGVSMTSLEEVFLKLEEDDTSFELKDIIDVSNLPKKSSYGSIAMSNVETQSPNDITPILTMDNAMATTCVDQSSLRKQQFWALCKIRFFRLLRGKGLVFFTLILPFIFVLTGLLVSKYVLSPSADTIPTPLSLQNAVTRYARSVGGTDDFPLLINDSVNSADSTSFMKLMEASYVTEAYDNSSDLLSVAPHHMGTHLSQYTVSGSAITSAYTALYNDSAIHSLPAVLYLMTSTMMAALNQSTVLSLVSLPWPRDENSRKYDSSAISSTVLVAMAFVTIPTAFGTQLVKDRQFKIRSQLRLSGVSFWMYWASTFFVDIIQFSIPGILSVIVVLALQPPSLSGAGAVVAMLLLFLCFLPNATLFTYLVSFLFDKFETCQAALTTVFFLISFIPYILVSILDMLVSASVSSTLHYCFLVVDPPYAVFGGFYYIDRVYRVHQYSLNPNADIPFGDYFSPEIVLSFVIPLLHIVPTFFAMRALDIRKTGGDIKETCPCVGGKWSGQVIPHRNEDAIDNEDKDVSSERRRVQNIKSERMDVKAHIENLRKEFTKDGVSTYKNCKKVPKESKTKVAVRNATFAVDSGEVFGLLGPNGAGKSTTLNMMIAELGPTKGKVVVEGYDVHSSMSDAFKVMGYCPQHDALWEEITLQEHIDCFTRLRGIPPDEIPLIIDYFLENMKIDEHKNKRSAKLSGGTKRKLSYILSILGRPKIVLLDEPSTGMDPQSKRFLWDTITSCFEGSDRAAILTTHYMEEADALCSRVAIMVNGKIQCLGSTQHLKDRFGSGYLLEVKLQRCPDPRELTAKMERLEEQVMELFPDAVCLEKFAERAHYKLPQESIKSLSESFSTLEKAKTTHSLEEYSFSQSTLEQVFLQFARKQLDEESDEAALDNGEIPAVTVESSVQHDSPGSRWSNKTKL